MLRRAVYRYSFYKTLKFLHVFFIDEINFRYTAFVEVSFSRSLEKELRLLKRQQNLQGSELVRLENSETYPVKLKQLMEEVRFARER